MVQRHLLAVLWALIMLLNSFSAYHFTCIIDQTRSCHPRHPSSLYTKTRVRHSAKPLRAVNVFDLSSNAETAKLVVVNVIGVGLYVLLQLIAPKLGLVDETKAKEGYKEGEEPWNL